MFDHPSGRSPRAALCLALLLTACPGDKAEDSSPGDSMPPEGCVVLDDGSCVVETFANPPVLEPDADGVYQLTFGPAEVEINGERHCVRAYNGSLPSPTLEVAAREGDTERKIRVDFHNQFTKSDYQMLDGTSCTCTDDMGEACDPHSHDVCGMEGEEHDCSCVDSSGEVCDHAYDMNTTNLHFHGTHVEPDAANGGGCTADGDLRCRDCDTDTCDDDPSDDTCYYSDDVLNVVAPGQGSRYLLDLDEDGTHHEGISWYHPHIHGSTALQVAGGSAGALLIRGPLDEVPGVADARERVVVFGTPPVSDNGFEPLADGVTCTEDTLTFNSNGVINSAVAPQLNVVNGQRQPRMLTPPGQVERWRMVHAGFLDEVFMGLRKGEDSSCSSWSSTTLPIHQIARDNMTLEKPYDSEYLFMSPGYRIEMMLGGEDFQDGDTWCLVAYRFLQDDTSGGPVEFPVPLDEADIQDLLDDGDLVAILNVSSEVGEPTETEMPSDADLAAVAPSTTIEGVSAEDRCEQAAEVEDPEDIDQVVVMQVGFFTATTDTPDPCDCGDHNINCDNYGDVDRESYPWDRDLPLGEVQQWRLASSKDGHTFHIHTNPFLVCPDESLFDPIPYPHWRDTYLVNGARKIDAISQYNRFTGGFVLHCHKLTHEDDGMMERIRVCDPATDPTCGDYTWDACEDEDLTCEQHLASTECAMLADNDVEALACVAQLAGPDGVCGPNACATDDDCSGGESCVDYVCE